MTPSTIPKCPASALRSTQSIAFLAQEGHPLLSSNLKHSLRSSSAIYVCILVPGPTQESNLAWALPDSSHYTCPIFPKDLECQPGRRRTALPLIFPTARWRSDDGKTKCLREETDQRAESLVMKQPSEVRVIPWFTTPAVCLYSAGQPGPLHKDSSWGSGFAVE